MRPLLLSFFIFVLSTVKAITKFSVYISPATTPTTSEPSTTSLGPIQCPCGMKHMVFDNQNNLKTVERTNCIDESGFNVNVNTLGTMSTSTTMCFLIVSQGTCKHESTQCRDSLNQGFYLTQKYNFMTFAIYSTNHTNYVNFRVEAADVFVKCSRRSCPSLFRDGLRAYTNDTYYTEFSKPIDATNANGKAVIESLNRMLKLSKSLDFDFRAIPRSLQSDYEYSMQVADMLKPDQSTTVNPTTSSSAVSVSGPSQDSIAGSAEEPISSESESRTIQNPQQMHDSSVSATTAAENSSMTEMEIAGCCAGIFSLVVLCFLFVVIFFSSKYRATVNQTVWRRKDVEEYRTSAQKKKEKEDEVRTKITDYQARDVVLSRKVADFESREADCKKKLKDCEEHLATLKVTLAELTKAQTDNRKKLLDVVAHATLGNKQNAEALRKMQDTFKADMEERDKEMDRIKAIIRRKDEELVVLNAELEQINQKLAAPQ